MQWAAKVYGQILGHINNGRDGTQANCCQPRFEPLWAFLVFQAANRASHKMRTQMRVRLRQTHRHMCRTFERTLNGLYVDRLQCTQTGGGQIPSNTAHTKGINTVGRERDIYHRLES